MTKRVLELIRVSTESQAGDDRSFIPAQHSVNQRTANAYGLTIVRSIEISDVSGAAVLLAPEIQELLLLMADPEIHGVVAREFSRLMRPENFADYALLQAFADTRTLLYLPEGPIDFASKTGRLMGTIRAAIAGMERTEILERIWSAKEEKRRTGGFGQSRICLPFGVTYNDVWSFNGDAERVREAFRLMLGGEVSYTEIGRRVGIASFNLRNILRNPIYTGWRVIDKKRDTSASGKYPTRNGRQGDRRKIMRAPEDVIRVKVMEPLVSESDFAQVQHILDVKKSHHWRTREGYESRFTYRGLLLCAVCEGLVYTKFRRADYYVCKARHIGHTCVSGYMRRERLEAQLDSVFADDLTSPRYLRQIEREMKKARPQVDTERMESQLRSLTTKRQRILDSYFEGVIDSSERDARLAATDREQKAVSVILAKQNPAKVETDLLAKVFGTFLRFKKLAPQQKRRLLTAIAPEIVVADYQVKGLYFSTGVNHLGMDFLTPERIYLPLYSRRCA